MRGLRTRLREAAHAIAVLGTMTAFVLGLADVFVFFAPENLPDGGLRGLIVAALLALTVSVVAHEADATLAAIDDGA